ncbi:regulator of nucleoside diphosphate kinase [Flavisolibacter ginsengisoli DSM 18119]|uniref:Regulator of nucleoside diphosphate kinase n=2 Tax=Flavisolibacter TaxID=398041 RepID=A0A1M5A7M8_9BACT|nr:regulator of nucleoside diphosphate kinase [Flavisolibacter ginsengisoli DSM 18119]
MPLPTFPFREIGHNPIVFIHLNFTIMTKTKNQLLLRKDDYDILINCIRSGQGKTAFDHQNIEELESELKKARLVPKDQFPGNVVRLNSRVVIKEDSGKQMELMVVIPEQANIKERKISVMAPIGTALLGFKQGEKIAWEVPSGKKTFTIVKVVNE